MDKNGRKTNKDKVEKDRYRGRLEWDLPSLWNREGAVKQERRKEKNCLGRDILNLNFSIKLSIDLLNKQ